MISTLSLLTDIQWVVNLVVGETEDYSANNAEQAGQLARAGRGARIGTRAARITRVIRLVRLIRIGRLWKQANSRLNRATTGNLNDEFTKALRTQRTINMMKHQKQVEASKKDVEKINRRATVLMNRKSKRQEILGTDNHHENGSVNESESNLKESSMISQDLSESKIEEMYPENQDGKLPLASSMMLKSDVRKSISSISKEYHTNESDDIVAIAAKTTSNESKVGKILSEST